MKMVWITTSFLFILAVLFTVTNLTNFNSQNASAAPRGINEVAVKIKLHAPNFKAGLSKAFSEQSLTEEQRDIIKEFEDEPEQYLKNLTHLKFGRSISENTNLRFVEYDPENRSEWQIYYLLNQDKNTIVCP